MEKNDSISVRLLYRLGTGFGLSPRHNRKDVIAGQEAEISRLEGELSTGFLSNNLDEPKRVKKPLTDKSLESRTKKDQSL